MRDLVGTWLAPDRYLLVLRYLVGTFMVEYPVPYRTRTVILLVAYVPCGLTVFVRGPVYIYRTVQYR